MEFQKICKAKYVEELFRGVKSGNTLPLYENDAFELNEEKLVQSSAIYKPENAAFRMPGGDGMHDFENAKILFNAYRDLTPLQASDIRLWTYLAHADYYPYMKRRWPKAGGEEDKSPSRYILDHWFIATP